MKIENIHAPKGAHKRKKIVGRGIGSGHGKTSTRGHKGQRARSGSGKRPGFEGGQMSLIRRLPKRGFRSYPDVKFNIINLWQLKELKEVSEITPEYLRMKGIIKGKERLLKVLGEGELDSPVNIKAHAFSKSAVEKINRVGGKVEIIDLKSNINRVT